MDPASSGCEGQGRPEPWTCFCRTKWAYSLYLIWMGDIGAFSGNSVQVLRGYNCRCSGILEDYGWSWSFHWGATLEARARGTDPVNVDVTNRWRSFEGAMGHCPRLAMRDHYLTYGCSSPHCSDSQQTYKQIRGKRGEWTTKLKLHCSKSTQSITSSHGRSLQTQLPTCNSRNRTKRQHSGTQARPCLKVAKRLIRTKYCSFKDKTKRRNMSNKIATLYDYGFNVLDDSPCQHRDLLERKASYEEYSGTFVSMVP